MNLSRLRNKLAALGRRTPQDARNFGAAGERLKAAIRAEVARLKANPPPADRPPLDLSTIRGTDGITQMMVAQVRAARAGRANT